MGAPPNSILLKDHTAEELHALLAELGVSPRLARRLQASVLQRGGNAIPAELPEVSRRLLERVRENVRVPSLTLLEKAVSPSDGFTKYLFRGEGQEPFEAVRIPLLHRPGDSKYERVMRAARILSEPCGMAIDAKAITISTVGIVPAIRRFTAERRPYRLVVSLTSADPKLRRELLPIEATHSLTELREAISEYQQATGRRIVLAWTLLSGINTSPDDARQLAAWTAGLPVQLDLIDVNDPTGQFLPPAAAELNAFRDALSAELKMPVVRRYSGGQDVNGGCGMLAGLAQIPQS